MLTIVTHCDKNYLLKALAMHHSLCETMKEEKWRLEWLCNDEETYDALKEIKPFNTCIHLLSNIERLAPELVAAKENPLCMYARSAHEQYMWTITPFWINCCLNNFVKPGETLVYADADIYFYRSPSAIVGAVGEKSVGIHTHRFGGAYNDKTETGWYNVGVLVFRNDDQGTFAAKRWNRWVLDGDKCEFFKEYGTCGDQKYLNLFIPVFGQDNICVFDQEKPIGHFAPWNCSNVHHNGMYRAAYKNKIEDIYFFHFSHFRTNEEVTQWFDYMNLPPKSPEWRPSADSNVRPYYVNYFKVISEMNSIVGFALAAPDNKPLVEIEESGIRNQESEIEKPEEGRANSLLEKVAHLYIGCETNDGRILMSVDADGEWMLLDTAHGGSSNFRPKWDKNVKLALRRVSSLTEKEQEVWNRVSTPIGEMAMESAQQIHWSKRLNYYRSLHMDCDQLIENGFAIEKA